MKNKVEIPEDAMSNHAEKIREMINLHKDGPESLLGEFDEYLSYTNGIEEKVVEDFLKAQPPHTFDEYAVLMNRYHDMAKTVNMRHERTIFCGIFEVRKKHILSFVENQAQSLLNLLLDRMVDEYQAEVKK